jgi:ADP-heptose:LPS heptosyltransferase
LGDCILSTPAIHLVKRQFPSVRVGVVVEPAWRAVYEDNPDVSHIVEPTNGSVWDFDPDVCIDFHGGNTAARLTFFSGAQYRIGFRHFKRRPVYNIKIPRVQDITGYSRIVHTAEHMAVAMFYLGARPADIPRARLFAASPAPRPPYAVIHPVAATPEKTWPAAGFLRVAEYLQREHQLQPVFIAARDQDLSAFRGYETVVGAPLPQIKSLISGAGFFVGNDSGPAHMAAAFGVPPVVIFGPSDPVIWGPWGLRGEVLTADGPIDSVHISQVTAAIDRLRVAA